MECDVYSKSRGHLDGWGDCGVVAGYMWVVVVLGVEGGSGSTTGKYTFGRGGVIVSF